jgi:hypothetical protein
VDVTSHQETNKENVMALTLESLDQRLAALEQQVALLTAAAPVPEVASRGARLIREAEASRATVVAAWQRFLTNLGIAGQPVGAKKLRERMLAAGMNPADNSFSREIIAMREE